jgi:hypothetical protein
MLVTMSILLLGAQVQHRNTLEERLMQIFYDMANVCDEGRTDAGFWDGCYAVAR